MPKQPRSNRPDTPGRAEEYFQRGFQFYLDGRHGTFCGQHQAAGYLFHVAVELMLKSILLTDAGEEASARVWAAREPLIERDGPDAVLDPDVADALLQPYRERADQLERDYGHSIDKLWRDSIVRLGNRQLAKFRPLITKVAQWEKYRYPIFVHSRSNTSTLSTSKGARVKSSARELINRSEVNRPEVDELIRSLIDAVGYTDTWVRVQAATEIGLDTYRRDNRSAIPGL